MTPTYIHEWHETLAEIAFSSFLQTRMVMFGHWSPVWSGFLGLVSSDLRKNTKEVYITVATVGDSRTGKSEMAEKMEGVLNMSLI